MGKQGWIDTHGAARAADDQDECGDQYAIVDVRRAARLRDSSLDVAPPIEGSTHAQLFALADGVDALPAPAEASAHALRSALRHLRDDMPLADFDDVVSGACAEALREACLFSDQQLAALADGSPRAGMASTLTLAYVAWPTLLVAHVGHSRVYLLRGGQLTRLTGLHTVGEVRRQLSDTERPAPERRELWNAVGGQGPTANPELRREQLRLGDVLLLCTDGVLECVGEREVARVLGAAPSAEQACQQLLAGASSVDRSAVVARFGAADTSTSEGRVAYATPSTSLGVA